MNNSQQKIAEVCDSIKRLLISKNKKYGDSALNPVRIFSKADSVEQINVRIDDKLSRICNGVGLLGTDEDVLMDLIGYLVLLKIAMADRKNETPKPEQWDGSDIIDFTFPSNTRDIKVNGIFPADDTGLLDLHTSGDRFA